MKTLSYYHADRSGTLVSSCRFHSKKNTFAGLLGVVLLAASTVVSHAATAADFQYGTLPKAGTESYDLPYRFLVPAAYYNTAQSYPLIVFLHGAGEKGTNNTSQLNNNANGALQLVSAANQAAYPCFMLAPQAHSSQGWNSNTLGQVIRAITTLSQTYAIDPNRIYVTGLSMGGNGTWNIVGLYPFTFAAAVPMSGWGSGNYDRMSGLPIWAFHAANDSTVGVNGSDNPVSSVRAAGGRVIYTRYATGGHGIWSTAYGNPALLPWMMAQQRNQPVAGTPNISITNPATHLLTSAAPANFTVSGAASFPGGVSSVKWTNTPWVGGAGVNSSTYPLANGLESWSVSNVPNSDSFHVIANGPSGSASLGGASSANDFLWKPNTAANQTLPTLSITAPTTGAAYTTSVGSLNLSGTAATTAQNKTIRQISWSNNRGGQGFAAGTTSWTIQNIDLQPGENVITLTVRDNNNYSASTTFTAHFGVVPPNTAPVISDIADINATAGASIAPAAFAIGDAETTADSLQLSITSSNSALLPASAATISGSGTNRTLTLSPLAGQSGTTTVTVSVSDGLLSVSDTFVLTVVEPVAPVFVEVDFGMGNNLSTGNINNIASATSGAITSAITTNGSATTISIAVTDGFSGINSAGVNQTAAFVSTAQSDSFYIDASGNTVGIVTISNLAAAKIYDLSLFASRVANDNRTTLYTVHGVSQSINAANNASQLVNFNGLAPVNGQIVIEVRAGAGSNYGYLNALRLKEITP